MGGSSAGGEATVDCGGCQDWSREKMSEVMEATSRKIERLVHDMQGRPEDNDARERDYQRVKAMMRWSRNFNREEWDTAHAQMLGNFSLARRLIENLFPQLLAGVGVQIKDEGVNVSHMNTTLTDEYLRLGYNRAELQKRISQFERGSLERFDYVNRTMERVLEAEIVANGTWLANVHRMHELLERFDNETILQTRGLEVRRENVLIAELARYFYEGKGSKETQLLNFVRSTNDKIDYMHRQLTIIRGMRIQHDKDVNASVAAQHKQDEELDSMLYRDIEEGMEKVFRRELRSLNASITTFASDYAFNISEQSAVFADKVRHEILDLGDELESLITDADSGLVVRARTQLLAMNESNEEMIANLSAIGRGQVDRVNASISGFKGWLATKMQDQDALRENFTNDLLDRIHGLRVTLATVHDGNLAAEKEQQEVIALIHADLEHLAGDEDKNETSAEGEAKSLAQQMFANVTRTLEAQLKQKHTATTADLDEWAQIMEAWASEAAEQGADTRLELKALAKHISEEVDSGKARVAELKAELETKGTDLAARISEAAAAGEQSVASQDETLKQVQLSGEQKMKAAIAAELSRVEAKVTSDEWLLGYVKGNLQVLQAKAEESASEDTEALSDASTEISSLQEIIQSLQSEADASVANLSTASAGVDKELLARADVAQEEIAAFQAEHARLRVMMPGNSVVSERTDLSLWANLSGQLNETARQLSRLVEQAKTNSSVLVQRLKDVGDSSTVALEKNWTGLQAWDAGLETEELARDEKEKDLAQEIEEIDGLIDVFKMKLEAAQEAAKAASTENAAAVVAAGGNGTETVGNAAEGNGTATDENGGVQAGIGGDASGSEASVSEGSSDDLGSEEDGSDTSGSENGGDSSSSSSSSSIH